MKHLFVICLLTLGSLTPSFAKDIKVLMLISSYGTEAQPDLSYDLEELAQSYLVMYDNGIHIDIASPKGGPVLVKNNKDDLAYIQRFKGLALNQLSNTLATSELDVNHYDSVFIIGGGGAMMDLPFHAPTQQLLTAFVHKNKLVTAVCHGPAAIADIKLADGQFFVSGKRVNSFTNIEEQAFSKENAKLFKFLIQDKLVENGARFVSNHAMLPFVSQDQNLITAQNPSSVAKAAEATTLKLGLPLKNRTLFKDEATMQLISQARMEGSGLIDLALAKDKDRYDMNYLALYAFYAYPLAAEQDKWLEVGLMETIGKHFQHIEFDTALIKRLAEQKAIERAKVQLSRFKQRYPESGRVTELSALVTL